MAWQLILVWSLVAYLGIGTAVFLFLFFIEKASLGESLRYGFFWLPLTILHVVSEGLG